MASTDPRTQILDRMYKALWGPLPSDPGAHDELFDQYCHPGLVLDFTGRTFDGALAQGRQGFRDLAQIQSEVWEAQTITPEEYIVVEARGAHSRLFRDGRIARWRVYQSKEEAMEDVGSE